MKQSSRVRLVVFDWAGTTVDHGCFAPLAPFIDTFAHFGVKVTPEQARGPMGLHKKDHLRALSQLPAIVEAWHKVHDRECREADIDEMFSAHFIPLQLAAVGNHCVLIPGLLNCVTRLKEQKVEIATTTGYFREAAELARAAAARQGYQPQHNLCPEDVSAGRPAPWMIFRHMETLGVFPPSAVVKVGDTVPDIEEGLNAGVWSVGVTQTGSEVGCTLAEWQALPAAEQTRRKAVAGEKLLATGAHYIVDSVADLPALLPKIEARLERGA